MAEPEADGEQGRRDTIRYRLTRRLLDDPVVYGDTLDAETQAYFFNQRGPLASRICEATGLSAEQRAEGLALTDESGQLTDVSMPAEGTEAHVTLLVAGYLAEALRDAQPVLTDAAVAAFLRGAVDQYGRYWRKSAREPGAELELTEIALDRLHRLQLIDRDAGEVRPLPAVSRFAIGRTELHTTTPTTKNSLFDL